MFLKVFHKSFPLSLSRQFKLQNFSKIYNQNLKLLQQPQIQLQYRLIYNPQYNFFSIKSYLKKREIFSIEKELQKKPVPEQKSVDKISRLISLKQELLGQVYPGCLKDILQKTILLIELKEFDQAKESIKELYDKNEKEQGDEANKLFNKCQLVIMLYNIDLAQKKKFEDIAQLLEIKSILEEKEIANSTDELACCCNLLGQYYLQNGKLQEGIIEFEDAARCYDTLIEKNQENTGIKNYYIMKQLDLYDFMGKLSIDIQNYDHALAFYQIVYDTLGKIDQNKKFINLYLRSLNGIAACHMIKEEFDQAEEYFKKTEKFFTEYNISDSTIKLQVYLNLAQLYESMMNLYEATRYTIKAEEIYLQMHLEHEQQNKDISQIYQRGCQVYVQKIGLYIKFNKLNEAQKLIDEALNILKENCNMMTSEPVYYDLMNQKYMLNFIKCNYEEIVQDEEEILKQISNKFGEQNNYYSEFYKIIGLSYLKLNKNKEKGIQYLTKSYEILESKNEKQDEQCKLIGEIAKYNIENQKFEEAQLQIEKMEKIISENNDLKQENQQIIEELKKLFEKQKESSEKTEQDNV